MSFIIQLRALISVNKICKKNKASVPLSKSSSRSTHDYLSRRVKRQPPNPFAPLVPLMKDPTNHILSQGVPPMEIFPLSGISVTLSDGTSLQLSAAEVQNAQRYAPFAWGPLLSWCRRHMLKYHNPPMIASFIQDNSDGANSCIQNSDIESDEVSEHTTTAARPLKWDVAISAGSMSAVEMAFAMILEPAGAGGGSVSGDMVLVEEFSFTASLDCLKAMGCQCVKVEMDEQGIIPSKLRETLETCFSTGRMPKALYTIPVGQNPTGGRLPSERYDEIYQICQKFDLVIIEDDPYFYLQHDMNKLNDDQNSVHKQEMLPSIPSTTKKTPKLSLGKSFLSIDCDGRVLRIDSFSKVLAPGFRLGWVTGSEPFIKAFNGMAYCGSQNGSSLSMTILGKMLESFEGSDEFEKRVLGTQLLLKKRCASLTTLVSTHMDDLVEFSVPPAGLFLWLKLKPHLNDFPADETLHAAMKKHGIVFLPGSVCTVYCDSRSTSMRSENQCDLEKLESDGNHLVPFLSPQSVKVSLSTLGVVKNAQKSSLDSSCRYLRLSFVAEESTYEAAVIKLRKLVVELCSA